jgi:hypothetical protein
MWKGMCRYFSFLEIRSKIYVSMLHRYFLPCSFCQQLAGIISSLIFFDQRIHLIYQYVCQWKYKNKIGKQQLGYFMN